MAEMSREEASVSPSVVLIWMVAIQRDVIKKAAPARAGRKLAREGN